MGDISKRELKPVIRFFKKLFPVATAEEALQRREDKAVAASGDFGPAVLKEPPVIGGRLNRGKLLIGTTIFYDDKNIDEEDIKLISDGGFDFIINESSGEFQDMLAIECEKYALALISKDKSLPSGKEIPAALASGKDLFSDYKHHPARVGDTAGDEPHASLFTAMGEYYKIYNKRFPGKFLFCNLLPAGIPAKILGAKNYQAYIAEFVQKVPSDFISLDEYPFFSVSCLKRLAFAICLHTYDTVACACRESERDFWLYLQTQGNWFDLIYALPTFEQIRWQAYTALAYGAKCLMHVSFTPVWGTEAYAMIDKNGEVTEQYLYAKRINEEINALSPVYMRYKNLGVIPVQARKETGYLKTAFRRQRKSSAKKGFAGLDCVRAITAERSALAGYFDAKQGDSNALMIVNCSELYSADSEQAVVIELTAPRKATVYKKGKPAATMTADKNITVKLSSCEGVFITLEKL